MSSPFAEMTLSTDLALRLLRDRGRESFTTGVGSCLRNGRTPLAKYGADLACAACVADLALSSAAGGTE